MRNNWNSRKDNIGKQGLDGGIILSEMESPERFLVSLEKKTNFNKTKIVYCVTVVITDVFITSSYFKDLDDAKEHMKTIMLILPLLIR